MLLLIKSESQAFGYHHCAIVTSPGVYEIVLPDHILIVVEASLAHIWVEEVASGNCVTICIWKEHDRRHNFLVVRGDSYTSLFRHKSIISTYKSDSAYSSTKKDFIITCGISLGA